MSTFKNKNSLRTIEAEISLKVKNNEARPKFNGSYEKKRADLKHFYFALFFYLDLYIFQCLISLLDHS